MKEPFSAVLAAAELRRAEVERRGRAAVPVLERQNVCACTAARQELRRRHDVPPKSHSLDKISHDAHVRPSLFQSGEV